MTQDSNNANEYKKFRPSKADRWMQCTASEGLIESLVRENKLKPNETSRAIRRGDRLHSIVHKCLVQSIDPCDKGLKISEIDRQVVKKAISYFDAHVREDYSWRYEYKLSWFNGDRLITEGTSDAIGISKDGKEMRVVDWKFGRRRVNAEGNRQLLLYAGMAMRHAESGTDEFFRGISPERYEMYIVQPVSVDKEPNVGTINRSDLMTFMEEAEEKIDEGTDSKRSRFEPSWNICRYCRARPYCEAVKEQGFQFRSVKKKHQQRRRTREEQRIRREAGCPESPIRDRRRRNIGRRRR